MAASAAFPSTFDIPLSSVVDIVQPSRVSGHHPRGVNQSVVVAVSPSAAAASLGTSSSTSRGMLRTLTNEVAS
jgi:hypothetical protein